MKHIPGPWEMKDSQRSPAIYIIGHHTHIATINGELDYYNQILPNARLIAAAPDLYRELQRVEWIDDGDSIGRHCPWCGNYEHAGHMSDCTRQAAIAKIE